MQKLTPFLWFDGNAEEAVNFYTTVFPNAEIKEIHRWKAGGPMPEGMLLTAVISIDGHEYGVINGGPMYKLSPAFSIAISCLDQKEVDYYWNKLAEGGQEQACGWLADRYGVSWQVVPVQLIKWMNDSDLVKAQNVTNAMLKMSKIDIAELERAYKG